MPKARLEAAAATKAKAEAAPDAIAEAKRLPAQPGDCRKMEASGIVSGDRLDVAVLKADGGRRRANARVGRCAAWYDALKQGYAR